MTDQYQWPSGLSWTTPIEVDEEARRTIEEIIGPPQQPLLTIIRDGEPKTYRVLAANPTGDDRWTFTLEPIETTTRARRLTGGTSRPHDPSQVAEL